MTGAAGAACSRVDSAEHHRTATPRSNLASRRESAVFNASAGVDVTTILVAAVGRGWLQPRKVHCLPSGIHRPQRHNRPRRRPTARDQQGAGCGLDRRPPAPLDPEVPRQPGGSVRRPRPGRVPSRMPARCRMPRAGFQRAAGHLIFSMRPLPAAICAAASNTGSRGGSPIASRGMRYGLKPAARKASIDSPSASPAVCSSCPETTYRALSALSYRAGTAL